MKEERLDEIRELASVGALKLQATSYHGQPLLKGPVWTWEVPAYFFVGGAAGAAAVVGFTAQLAGADRKLVRDARWIAAAGAAISTPLLISDLGRPERFLNMLRVFKVQSPMSVGAWTLAVFGGVATIAALRFSVEVPPARRHTAGGSPAAPLDMAIAALSALTGAVMATYTGVLLGVTAIPVWSKNATLLPAHFGASALGSAVSLLELRGHRNRPLAALGLAGAAFESLAAFAIEQTNDQESEPLRRGETGITVRAAAIFSGPLPLVLRLLRKRKAAAAATLVGSLLTRMAWVDAGRASINHTPTPTPPSSSTAPTK